MRITLNKKHVRLVIITVIITVLVTLAVVAFAAWRGFYIFVDRTIDNIAKMMVKECMNDPLIIREFIVVDPKEPKKYDRKLAMALLDVGGAVTSSNCKPSIPIPGPFDKFEKIYGNEGNGVRNLYAYTFWSDTSDTAAIIFSGTYNQSQWYNNLKLNLVRADGLTASPHEVMIHRGFYEIYKTVQIKLWNWWFLQKRHRRDNNLPRIKYLVMSGRSLGGALSTICAYDMFKLQNETEIIHYTFASPRVGNIPFADEFNIRIPHSIRIYNTEDVVTDLPGAVMRKSTFKHVGFTEHTKPFTRNFGTIYDNHVSAYNDLPH